MTIIIFKLLLISPHLLQGQQQQEFLNCGGALLSEVKSS
jgi:hypothetical protein